MEISNERAHARIELQMSFVEESYIETAPRFDILKLNGWLSSIVVRWSFR